MEVYLLFEIVDMSDFHDNEYNNAEHNERVIGVYFCEEDAEKDMLLMKLKSKEYAKEFGCDESDYEIRKYKVR